MTRITLPDRREAVTQMVLYHTTTGGHVKILVTFGLDRAKKKVIEIFCADFKAGTDQHTFVMDACVMASLLMQHGYDAPTLLARLAGSPRSLVGQMLAEAVDVEAGL